MTDDPAARAARLADQLDTANDSRLRARTVSDARGQVTLETDERNELHRVKVTPNWTNLSADQLSEACVGAYQELGRAIMQDWADALAEANQSPAPAPRRARAQEPAVEHSMSVPPAADILRAVERTREGFAMLERLDAAGAAQSDDTDDEPVVGASRCGKVTATFTGEGMLTRVDVDNEFTSTSAVRLGEAIAEAMRDAQSQGEARQRTRTSPRDGYRAAADHFTRTHADTRAMMRRHGLVR
ncbi:hypothetical protein GCM10027418_20630 [Mariniluteicoccus endophyticus]